MNRLVIGIDPGVHGGIAWIPQHRPRAAQVISMPASPEEFVRTFTSLSASATEQGMALSVVVEHVQPRPGNSLQSSAAAVYQYGFLCGVISALGVSDSEILRISPQRWQRAFEGLNVGRDAGLDKTERRKATKRNSRAIAAELFPLHSARLAAVGADGLSDALLIASYGVDVVAKFTSITAYKEHEHNAAQEAERKRIERKEKRQQRYAEESKPAPAKPATGRSKRGGKRTGRGRIPYPPVTAANS